MSAALPSSFLIDVLSGLRGRLRVSAPLAPFTWFRVGGPAEVLVRPADADDLASCLAVLPSEVPLTVIGAASNLIIRDGGIPGVVVRLAGRGFGTVSVDGDGVVAGAAALDQNVAETAAAAGLAGLEFLSGIPGSIGGATVMNAGAYGTEMKDVLEWAEIVSRSGEAVRLAGAELALVYRRSSLPPGAVVVRVRLRAEADDQVAIVGRIAAVKSAREATQPVHSRTGGSTFQNPVGMKAWELIAAAGCRGARRGAAEVSEKHCNFLINTGRATAADLEALGEEVRERVRVTSGITLEWEIRRLGVPAREPMQ